MSRRPLEQIVRSEKLPLRLHPNLEHYSARLLKRICESVGLSPGVKRDMLRSLVPLLEDRFRVGPLVATLSARDNRLLHLLAHADKPSLTPLGLVRRARIFGVSGSVERLRVLCSMGLIVARWFQGADLFETELIHAEEDRFELFVPEGVASSLPEQESYELPIDASPEPKRNMDAKPQVARLLRESDIIIRSVIEQPAPLTLAGALKSAYLRQSVKRAKELLPGITERRVSLHLHLADRMGLLTFSPDNRERRISALGEGFLRLDGRHRLKKLFLASVSEGFDVTLMEFINEDVARNYLSAAKKSSNFSEEIGRDWSAIADLLRVMPPMRWLDLDSLVDIVGGDYPFLFFRNGRQAGKVTQRPMEPSKEQRKLQRALLLGFIEEIAWPFGAVEWAIGPKLKLLVRLSALGAWYMNSLSGGDEAPEEAIDESPEPKIVVQPDFDIVAFIDRMDFDSQYRLFSYAVPQEDADETGPVRRFRLTRRSVGHALDGGATLEEIESFLVGNAKSELPSNVLADLRDWEQSLGRAILYRGCDLLAYSNEAIAGRACEKMPEGRDIGAGLLLVSQQASPSGSLIDYDGTVPRSLRVGDDDRIRRVPGQPADLGLDALLSEIAICTDDEQDCWKLDRDAVTASGRRGKSLLEELRNRSEKLPDAVACRLLSYSGDLAPLQPKKRFVLDLPDKVLREAILALDEARHCVEMVIGERYLLLKSEGIEEFFKAAARLGFDVQESD